MEMNNKKNIILEEYENEFSYKKSKTNLDIQFNRIAFIFFVFLVISVIYSIQLLHLGSLKEENSKEFSTINKNYRADILDRNGNYLVKTVKSIDIGINPIEVIDKKKLLINLQLIFPDKNYEEITKKLEKNKFFYLGIVLRSRISVCVRGWSSRADATWPTTPPGTFATRSTTIASAGPRPDRAVRAGRTVTNHRF